MIRGHRIPHSSPRIPAKIDAEFKKQAPFTPGWNFGEVLHEHWRKSRSYLILMDLDQGARLNKPFLSFIQ
jgi:hypothetical protein